MNYRVQFFGDKLFIDMFNKNGDFIATYKTIILPSGETAKQKVIDTFKYIAYQKELGEF